MDRAQRGGGAGTTEVREVDIRLVSHRRVWNIPPVS